MLGNIVVAAKWLEEGSKVCWFVTGRRNYRIGWMAASLKIGWTWLGDDVVY